MEVLTERECARCTERELDVTAVVGGAGVMLRAGHSVCMIHVPGNGFQIQLKFYIPSFVNASPVHEVLSFKPKDIMD